MTQPGTPALDRRRALLLAGGAFVAAALPARARRGDDAAADIDSLNFLLSLEHLEAALVTGALSTFADADWEAAAPGADLRLGLETVRDQEQAHAAALKDAIAAAGGVPVDPEPYQFGYTDVAGFLRVAAGIGQTVVSAYAGEIPLIVDPSLRVTAIGIHSVEGRHAGWLKLRAGESPFPDPIDRPLGREDAQANLAGYSGAEAAAPQPAESPTVEVVVVTATPAPAPTVVVVTATPEPQPTETAAAPRTPPADLAAERRNVFAAVIDDAAARFGVAAEQVDIVDVTESDWPDSSLGCPKPGEVYLQVVTPGYLVRLDAAGQDAEYHTDRADHFVYCG